MEGPSLQSPAPPPVVAPPTGVGLDAFTLAYLQTHELECPACGYNVHRLIEPRCPECGRKLAVQVVMAEGGFRAAWVVALLASGISAGVGLLLFAVVLKEGMPRGNGPREASFFVIICYFLCSMPFPLLLLLLRRWYIRTASGLQWIAASIISFLTAVMITWFIVLIGR